MGDGRTESGWPLLRTVLRRQRRGLVGGMLVGLLWSLGKVAVPLLTREAVDRGVLGHGSLVGWMALITVAALMVGVFSGWRRYIAFRESRLTETRLREEIYEHVQRLHVGYHDHTQTGQLMSRASSDLLQIQGFVVMIPITASNLAMVLGVVVVLLSTQPMLALIALAPLPLVNLLAQRFSRTIHPAVLEVQAEQAQLATVVEESVSGVRVVKGFGAEGVQATKLAREADDIRRVSLRAARIRSNFLPTLDLVPLAGLLAVLAFGGHRVVAGQMSYGQMLEFMQYIAMVITPVRSLGMTVAFGQRAAAALIRVDEVLRTESQVTDPDQPLRLPDQPHGAVQFDHVRFGYRADQPVLDGFDLTIEPGTSVAVVGATGSGKSTVARLLTRFYDVQEGAIRIDGVDVRDLALRELRHAVSIVFEDTFLFDDSVTGNVAFSRPDASHADVERAARLAGAHDFVTALPEGYATVIGERGFSLSGGQRQRIAIARAILADPRVLVLDDATSAVDPSKEHEIRDAMATVMAGRTTIVIAHRAGTIALADRVVLIGDGHVLATGTHDELLATDARYREVLAALDDTDGDRDDDTDDDTRDHERDSIEDAAAVPAPGGGE